MKNMDIILIILGLILLLKDILKEISYKGRAKGYILNEFKYYDKSGRETYEYKYNISYIVDGKTYIYQQKSYSNIQLKNENIIIKYNKKNPQKSKLKGDIFISFIR